MAMFLLSTPMVFADIVAPDGDIVTPGDQATVNLGSVAPGAVLAPQTSFTLDCSSTQHLDQGQSLPLLFSLSVSVVPAGGSLSATDTSIGPIPAAWPDDATGAGQDNCGSPLPTLDDNGNSTVTITAPTTAGTYTFTAGWRFGAPTPAGNGDTNAVHGTTRT